VGQKSELLYHSIPGKYSCPATTPAYELWTQRLILSHTHTTCHIHTTPTTVLKSPTSLWLHSVAPPPFLIGHTSSNPLTFQWCRRGRRRAFCQSRSVPGWRLALSFHPASECTSAPSPTKQQHKQQYKHKQKQLLPTPTKKLSFYRN